MIVLVTKCYCVDRKTSQNYNFSVSLKLFLLLYIKLKVSVIQTICLQMLSVSITLVKGFCQVDKKFHKNSKTVFLISNNKKIRKVRNKELTCCYISSHVTITAPLESGAAGGICNIS